MKKLVLLMVFVGTAFAFDPNDISIPKNIKWANPESWNLKLCEKMEEGKVLSLLGSPMFVLYKGSEGMYWFYQEMPVVENISFDGGKRKYGKNQLKLTKEGYIYFARKRIATKDPYKPKNVPPFIPLKNKKNNEEKQVVMKSTNEFYVSNWKETNWDKVAHVGAKVYSNDFHKIYRNAEIKWKNSQNWKKLEFGISIERASVILGKPLYDEKPVEGKRIWQYTEIDGYGVVEFAVKKDKPEYYVTTWQEPYWPAIDPNSIE